LFHALTLVNKFDLVDSHFPVKLNFYIELALGRQYFVIRTHLSYALPRVNVFGLGDSLHCAVKSLHYFTDKNW
jgi:accessory gene regulator protein AgrB